MAAVGLCQVKINGIFETSAKGAQWDPEQPVAEHATGAGWEHATGMPKARVSFEQIILRQGATDFRGLKNFSVEIVDEETKQTVFLGEKCNWNTKGGRTDRGSANTTGSVSALCAKPVVY